MNHIDTKPFDVVIIGAGPAGCACALALIDSSLKVALIEKDQFPRDKTCGDAIPGPTLKHLKSIIPTFENSLLDFDQKQIVKTSKIITNKGRSITIKWKALALNSKRIDFDSFLFEKVKFLTETDVFENTKVSSIQTRDNHLIVESDKSTFKAKIVIGADGANSQAKKLLSKENQSPSAYSIRVYYNNINLKHDENIFLMLSDITGYFWIFPVGNNTFNVGIGFIKNDDSKIDLKKYLNQLIATDQRIKHLFTNATAISKTQGFPLPLGGNQTTRSANRLLLTGDAANLIDPLQGHGIDKAVLSGILAANQVKKCFELDDFSAKEMMNYDQEIELKIEKELQRNFRYMNFFQKHPWVLEFIAFLKQ